MNKFFLLFISGLLLFGCGTKPPVVEIKSEPVKKVEYIPEKKNYRSAYTKYFDLIHTRLKVSFNWEKKELIGEAAIILRPHFYSSDSLSLNARGMELKEVSMLTANGKHLALNYDYDSLLIKIKLDRIYSKEESFTLFISYISRPDNLPEGGSEAINNDKGLYFINADSLNPEKPTQIWTQGETESNSAWFPTIEDPSQKMTQEIYITVDTAMTTLSNGLFISSINNNDGTKTDYWKQSLPAAPYLTMIAAGKYSVIKERWKNIEVSYYVDPPYEKYASKIFGTTPEMLTFFSEKFGVPFVWEKYAQVVVHDYVSGAMENATAVVHGTNMLLDPREMIDENYEDYISHELSHHWFGNLVTCESWSNIPLNEGFANYSEYLWREYKYGRDEADSHIQSVLGIYLFSATYNDPPLIRYEYEDREEMYDAISYDKGGRVLHMLRNYVGDSAFFSSLQNYLSAHIFSTAEVADLRLSFEKITGEDLNWFFDQWFLKGGHPVINIEYNWNDSLHLQTVTIKQKQDFSKCPLYRLPLDIDIYYNGKKERKKIIVEDAEQSYNFDLPVKPDLVNVDAGKTLLCNKTDKKQNAELIFQYDHAPLYLDRYEAVSAIGANYKINTPEAYLMMKALRDKNYNIRLNVITNIGELAMNDSGIVKSELQKSATSDPSPVVRDKALSALAKYYSYSEFSQVFSNALNDSSYKVVARAFKIISEKDFAKAKEVALTLEKDSGNAVLVRLSEFYSTSAEDKTEFYKKAFSQADQHTRYQIVNYFTKYLKESSNPRILSNGIDILFMRAKFIYSKNKPSAYLNSLREIESTLKTRITNMEDELENIKDSVRETEKRAELQEWKTLKNKLHDKIIAIDN